MIKKYTYLQQENGSPSWICQEIENNIVINEYIVFESPLNWNGLLSGLITSKAFKRALEFPGSINIVAYGALQSILSTKGNELNLKAMLEYTMAYSTEEKEEINRLLSENYFTITLQ